MASHGVSDPEELLSLLALAARLFRPQGLQRGLLRERSVQHHQYPSRIQTEVSRLQDLWWAIGGLNRQAGLARDPEPELQMTLLSRWQEEGGNQLLELRDVLTHAASCGEHRQLQYVGVGRLCVHLPTHRKKWA